MILIRIILDTLNISQQVLGDKLDVSRQTISMWLSGYKISINNIKNINEVFKIDIELIEKSNVVGANYSIEEMNKIKNILTNNVISNPESIIIFELIKKYIEISDNQLLNQIIKIYNKLNVVTLTNCSSEYTKFINDLNYIILDCSEENNIVGNNVIYCSSSLNKKIIFRGE